MKKALEFIEYIYANNYIYHELPMPRLFTFCCLTENRLKDNEEVLSCFMMSKPVKYDGTINDYKQCIERQVFCVITTNRILFIDGKEKLISICLNHLLNIGYEIKRGREYITFNKTNGKTLKLISGGGHQDTTCMLSDMNYSLKKYFMEIECMYTPYEVENVSEKYQQITKWMDYK